MSDPEEVARIVAYLQRNRYTYQRSVLHEKLLADGHAPAAIEEAMRLVYGAEASTSAWPEFRASRVLIGLACYGMLNLALFALMMATVASIVEPYGSWLVALVFALIVGGIVFAVWRRQRDLAVGLLIGYALLSYLSGGTCTFLADQSSDRGLLMGFGYYPLIVVVLSVLFAIYQAFTARRRR